MDKFGFICALKCLTMPLDLLGGLLMACLHKMEKRVQHPSRSAGVFFFFVVVFSIVGILLFSSRENGGTVTFAIPPAVLDPAARLKPINTENYNHNNTKNKNNSAQNSPTQQEKNPLKNPSESSPEKETETGNSDVEESTEGDNWAEYPNGDWGGAPISYEDLDPQARDWSKPNVEQYQTSDDWPVFSKHYFKSNIPRSPYRPKFKTKWGFDVKSFLQRPDVKGQPDKIITWVVKPRNFPPLPEPVRMRICPEMPCVLTTNMGYRDRSAALIWNGQIMKSGPVPRANPDQVFVLHNNEPQKPDWNHGTSLRRPQWRNQFNWTWTYRNDSDLKAFYGYVIKRHTPLKKDYDAILAKKSKLAVWMSSHCRSFGRREQYVALLQRHVTVDVFGGCGPYKCAREHDDGCYEMFNEKYKFLLAFENAYCTDYISEKFFRYYESDMILVSRGSNEYKNHIPPGTFINANDFKTAEELAKHLDFLDKNPKEYIKILKKKDRYISLFEDWPIRNGDGNTYFMQYHFEAMGYCEMCRRLWNLDQYRKTYPEIVPWFDKGNCYSPPPIK